MEGWVETRFLLKCDSECGNIKIENFKKFDLLIPNSTELDDSEKQQIPLGERRVATYLQSM